jgi:transcriptional regulator of acetoin/glycerol metabolism
MSERPPAGWRVVVGVESGFGIPSGSVVSCERVELPTAEDLGDDLPVVVAAWLERLKPRVTISQGAIARLSRMTRDLGFEGVRNTLNQTLAAAGDSLEESDIPTDGYGTAFLDELLENPDPLAALEKRLLREVLSRSGWRMQEAAERLGVSRVTLWRKLRDHGIERPTGLAVGIHS